MTEQSRVPPPTRPNGMLDQPAGDFARPMIDDLERRSRRVPAEFREALAPRFVIDDEIGAGGMATVYRAFDSSLQRRVAIKVLRPELADGLTLDRFEREIAIAARLDHPRIVPLYDRGSAVGLLYYVMRYVDGESLRDRLEREKQLEIREAIAIVRHVAEALDHAHGQRVVHRDIKPENILLDGNGAYVADFGIARLQDAAGAELITRTGMAIGTVPYMSPEQIEASRDIDGRSDVYSLTCVLYEMLAGEPPYTGRSAQDVCARHLAAAIPDLSIVRPTVSAQMQHVIATGLRKNAVDRFPSARQLVDAFERAHTARMEAPERKEDRPVTVGVLPFANLSGDSANDYLSDGIADELISALIRAGRLRVLARTSTFKFKGQQRDIREIAEVLGATHLLEGSVRIAGRRLRATAQLVDADTGMPLWSEKYDRDLEDVFAVQDEITGAIADRLRRELDVKPKVGKELVFADFDEGEDEGKLMAVIVEPDRVGKASATSLRDQLAAATQGEYVIEAEIGEGAICTVFRARDVATDRLVAIKAVRPQHLSDKTARQRVVREAGISARLDHPNIASVYAVKERDDLVFFVTRYVEGTSLERVLQRFPQLSVPSALLIVRKVARALAYAHGKRVVHRDICPGNIMLDVGGHVLVTDFRLAIEPEPANLTALAAPGFMLGTLQYVSPEQVRGAAVSAASDQYSLGMVAYEMLAGRLPFAGGTMSEIMTGHLFAAPDSLRAHRDDVPPHIDAVIARMLAKDPADRYPDCAAVEQALGDFDEASGLFDLKSEVIYMTEPEKFPHSPERRRAALARVRAASAPRAAPTKLPRRSANRSLPAELAALLMWPYARIAALFKRRPPMTAPPRGPEATGDLDEMRVDEQLSGEFVIRQRFPAYDEYLRGRFKLQFESRHESIGEAIQHFDAAIAGNSGFAPAYAARSYARTMLARAGVVTSAAAHAGAASDAKAARGFDPHLAEAHLAEALVSAFFERNQASALASLDEATRSSPVYAEAYLWRGFVLNWMERKPDAAIEALDRALDLDPLSLVTRVELAFAALMKRDLEQALRDADEAVASGLFLGTKPRGADADGERKPGADGFAAGHYVRGVVLAEMGRLEEALVEGREALRLGGRQAMHFGFVGMVHALRGDTESAHGIIAKLVARAEEGTPVSTALATVYAGLRDRHRTLAALRDARATNDVSLVLVPASPHFAHLRSDPEFVSVVAG